MSNRAWVTLATNDSYGLGALVLAHSLRRVQSAYPAVVLITPAVTDAMRDRLQAIFAEVITVNVLDSNDAAHLALLQRPELGITFTKIHCWSLTQYDKCIFLDADTLILQNSDELFEREELSAAPDVGWPDCFNSGVFVYRPSQETFASLISFAKERGSFDGGDQGLLNSYFSDWAHGDINKHLPFLYNVTSAAFYSYLPALKEFGKDIKIIHFIGAAKPWLQSYNWESHTVDAPGHLRETLQLWWDIFVSSVHIQLHVSMSGVAGNLARVAPGASGSQREALDELTRRQGWEAGNIDYMGADSFDNIWAKISQTLSQAPKQSTPPPKEPTPTPKEQTPPPKQPTPPPKQPTPPPKQPTPPPKQPTPPPKQLTPPPTQQAVPPKETTPPVAAPAPVKEPSPAKLPEPTPELPSTVETKTEEVKPTEESKPEPAKEPEQPPAPVAAQEQKPAEDADIVIPEPAAAAALETVAKTEPIVPSTPPTPPVTPKTTPEESTTPVTELPPAPIVELPKTVEEQPAVAPTSEEKVTAEAKPSLPLAEVPASPKAEKSLELSETSSDSPPLANTPSKETAPPVAKSEGERRKPAGKLELKPPVALDPVPTPDSEAEDAATLAQSIIASELATPTVTAASPDLPTAPAQPQPHRLSPDQTPLATPPAGPVSLAQIGVKAKPSTAAQIESSLADKPTTPPTTPTDAPKKKIVKKVAKKESQATGEAPVPPPRKKEKKPKEK